MAFTTIEPEELVNKGVKSLPDTPDMAASELKSRFDSLGDLCVSHIRTLVNELQAETAAVSVGATAPEGISSANDVQDILNALAILAKQNEELSHTHANKEILDTFTAEEKARYDTTALKLDGVTSVEDIIHNSDSEIPTSGAVVDYVNARLAQLGLGG